MPVAARLGFRRAGLPHSVRAFPWSHGRCRFLTDLQDAVNVAVKGDELADAILAQKRYEPTAPIFVVAHSGGTGVVARAAERLPPNCLQRVVFLASALSPCYDLRPLLVASRGGVVSYYSANDGLILGWGTRTFGTIDRAYVASAGYKGFRPPCGLDAAGESLYATQLVQVPWLATMALRGNWGTHNGSLLPCFLAGEVVRWLQ